MLRAADDLNIAAERAVLVAMRLPRLRHRPVDA
jgi:hypothetical protein